MNGLTTQAGLRLGPILLETLVKHYLERLKSKAKEDDPTITQLRQDELLYDEAFTVVKKFLTEASYHTVEEVQAFGNTRTPSPPWVHVVRLVIPMSCCDDAAQYVITALGGEEVARRVVGGCKWWQVRGVSGIDAQWITAKKDWQEAKRRDKMRDKPPPSPSSASGPDSAPYEAHMDEMRCILYSHGGGYYFGSVDQERYSIQRHARKINGRVFAINYRLAPQYPFPCALQDILAAYLYLIRPPPGAPHRPLNPAHIVVAGDSAGGGLTLALLQVLRDTGLPLPAGGVLISPWCDLTHSFPSIHTNTATDVIPAFGLSFQKPSSLWPPPSEELSQRVHASLRTWIRSTFKGQAEPLPEPATPPLPIPSHTDSAIDVGATAPMPLQGSEVFTLTTSSGNQLQIDQQVHLYAQNSQLAHPLISSSLSYLGGLPPLFFIASDKEVLRDEIIYAAHKAAKPETHPIKEEVRAMYPPLDGIEAKYGPTRVHLQVYDDTAHVLPVLFSFTTPGKFCYRAIAAFCRNVTGMKQPPPRRDSSTNTKWADKNDLSHLPPLPPSPMNSAGFPNSDGQEPGRRSGLLSRRLSVFRSPSLPIPPARSASLGVDEADTRNSSYFSYFGTPGLVSTPSDLLTTPSDAPLTGSPPSTPLMLDEERAAGEPEIYETKEWKDGAMLRERVSTRGAVRPLEPESELAAFSLEPEKIGVISELAMQRYIDGRRKFNHKFASAFKTVEKHRRRNLEQAKKDIVRNTMLIQNMVGREDGESDTSSGLAVSGNWGWAWALDNHENPPPSSIVSRRDTHEALRLARIADQSMLRPEEHSLTANNLWSVITNFLTVDKRRSETGSVEDAEAATSTPRPPLRNKSSTLSKIFAQRSKDPAAEVNV
ncbi:unnamed protein product [Mycena citricolor]|uniref:Alpha/beta hydrolase fold-3 domain-containing protein n=1 Tax=Mycena citricolor TaxID=2018698 RepID=A0AAD2Q6P3_9AGAR|nr:unnamed protein product [Mycena citricolor]